MAISTKQRLPFLPLTVRSVAPTQQPDWALICDQQIKLIAAFQDSASLVSVALEALQAARATTAKIEYERLLGYVEQAILRAEQARLNLEEHMHAHAGLEISR